MSHSKDIRKPSSRHHQSGKSPFCVPRSRSAMQQGPLLCRHNRIDDICAIFDHLRTALHGSRTCCSDYSLCYKDKRSSSSKRDSRAQIGCETGIALFGRTYSLLDPPKRSYMLSSHHETPSSNDSRLTCWSNIVCWWMWWMLGRIWRTV